MEKLSLTMVSSQSFKACVGNLCIPDSKFTFFITSTCPILQIQRPIFPASSRLLPGHRPTCCWQPLLACGQHLLESRSPSTSSEELSASGTTLNRVPAPGMRLTYKCKSCHSICCSFLLLHKKSSYCGTGELRFGPCSMLFVRLSAPFALVELC